MEKNEVGDGASGTSSGVVPLRVAFCARIVAAALLLGSTSGCASWPETATGGLAEMYPSSSGRINELERRFAAQALGPAADLAPALLVEARGHLIRAKREQAGGLLADAETSADRVEAILRGIETNWPPPRRAGRRL